MTDRIRVVIQFAIFATASGKDKRIHMKNALKCALSVFLITGVLSTLAISLSSLAEAKGHHHQDGGDEGDFDDRC